MLCVGSLRLAFMWEGLSRENMFSIQTTHNPCVCVFQSTPSTGNQREMYRPPEMSTFWYLNRQSAGSSHGFDVSAQSQRQPSRGTDFKCLICGLELSNSSNLKRHQVTHTGERHFECPHCPASFALNHNLKRHIKSLHIQSTIEHQAS